MLNVSKNELIDICDYKILFIDLPPNIHSIFISSATQQLLKLAVDEDVTQENNSKMIEKEILLNDIQTNGQGSNFYEFQQQIQVFRIFLSSYYI